VSTGQSCQSTDVALVAILMGTKNGAAFLPDQLRSIADQTHENWFVIASDDGSADATRTVLARFASSQRQKCVVRDGPRLGAGANFMSLATDPTIQADYFAFSDQDDIWHRDKLRRALVWLASVPSDMPALYGGRTELITVDGKPCGMSPLFVRQPTFRNALVQSLAGGNTMVFNRAAKTLLETAAVSDVAVHDWWLYQLISAAGGAIHYDPQPMLQYRQHPDNLFGSNLGWRARLDRIRMMLDGGFRAWNEVNVSALQGIPAHLIAPENRVVLRLFVEARNSSFIRRLMLLRRCGVYRQTLGGNAGVYLATLMNLI